MPNLQILIVDEMYKRYASYYERQLHRHPNLCALEILDNSQDLANQASGNIWVCLSKPDEYKLELDTQLST